jgi:glycosyltransferase involved in cell wall biosynthesis
MSTTEKKSATTYPALAFDANVKSPRPSRVCIASFDFVGPVRNGGVGTAFTSLGEALAAAGHEVTFLFLAGRWCENRTLDYWIEEYRKKGIKFVPMPESGLRFETSWHIAKAYEAYLWLQEQNFDVIHFSEWKGPGYFSLLAKHQGLAFDRTLLCVHTHGPSLWHKLSNGEYVTYVDDVHMDYLECRSVQLAEVLVSPSQYLLRWMLERNWALPEKTFVQPYVRPATARKPLPDADRCHQVKELVFFGRLEDRKGLVLFCDALDLLKDDPQLRHASLAFLGKADKIGNRDSADYLADRAKSWPWKWQLISDRDQVGAMDYLQGTSRLAVLPSLVDNLPNTVLECLGAKVPFIASNAGGIPEMIAAADLDETCFPLQARAFADKLRHMLLNGIRPATPAWDSQENENIWVKWHENQLAAQPALLPSVSLELSVSNPLVSVCMSHWNRPHYLRQALASIEAMDYPNYEVVLVDDGSTQPEALKLIDELTPEFARRGWQLLRNSENRYPGAPRNLAARHARGEYLMLMDDDNCAKPHELSTFMRVARKTGADILTCCLDTFTGADAPHVELKPRSRWVFVGDDAATGAIRNCFGDTNSLIRREVFLSLGGFHED